MSQLGDRPDVSGVDLAGGHMLLAAREEDLRQPLIAAAVEVGEVLVGLDGTGQDLEVADPAELVTAGAEDERLRRLARVAFGRRQQLGDGRHQGANTQQLGRGAADDRRHLAGEDSLAQPGLDFRLVERAGVQILLQERVVALGCGLDQLAAVLVDELRHVVRDRRLGALAIAGCDESLQVQQVDDAAKVLLGADGEMKRERSRRQVLAHGAHRAVEVGVLFVELVYNHEARLVGAIAELPRDLGADGHLPARADDDDRALGGAQPAQRLARKIEEPRRVEDVDLEAGVLGKADAEVDRDLPPLFFGLEVRGRRLLVRGAQPRDRPGSEQHGLGESRLAVMRVAEQDHVPDLFGRVISCHPTPNESPQQLGRLSLSFD